jgi:hypothetical protein
MSATAAKKYSTPYFTTSAVETTAGDPAPPVIIPGSSSHQRGDKPGRGGVQSDKRIDIRDEREGDNFEHNGGAHG